ncbi:MAG: ZIP family metal transporter [Oscillospiraceae bacterium]|nr:ZIP family metal transporter [Oscillospiraceae bacterium]
MFYAVVLCAVASLATGAGGVIVAFSQNFSDKKLAVSQGFAAGVMLGVSFMDMLPHSFNHFGTYMPPWKTILYIAVLLAAGWVVSLLLAKLAVPQQEDDDENIMAVRRLCFVTTAVVMLHNLPEGMLTSFSGFNNKEFGLQIAFAVALHNIPEGMAVASSVMYITSSKLKAVWQSFAAGIAELLGGVIALAVMHRFITQSFLMATLAVISGIMVQVSLCELLPAGLKISLPRYVFWGLIGGVIIISLGMLTI